MFDLFQAKAAKNVLDSIDGDPERLCILSEVELALLRANQQQSSTQIAEGLFLACKGDAKRGQHFIAQAMTLPMDEIRHRAVIGVESIERKQVPTLSQWAALLLVGLSETQAIEREIERREAGRRGAN